MDYHDSFDDEDFKFMPEKRIGKVNLDLLVIMVERKAKKDNLPGREILFKIQVKVEETEEIILDKLVIIREDKINAISV